MAAIELSIPKFRAQFAAFSDPLKYPDSVIEYNWEVATCFVSDNDYGRLNGKCREFVIYNITAHMMAIDNIASSGSTMYQVNSSTIGDVSVSSTPPTSSRERDYWFTLSVYGMNAKAMIKSKSAGGFLYGVGACGRYL